MDKATQQGVASMNEMVSRYKAHNDGVAERLGIKPPARDHASQQLEEARHHLARANRSPSTSLKVAAMQDAIESLLGAVEARSAS